MYQSEEHQDLNPGPSDLQPMRPTPSVAFLHTACLYHLIAFLRERQSMSYQLFVN